MSSQRCQPFNVMLYPVCGFLLIVPFIKSVEIEVALLVVYTAGVAILHLDYGIFVVSYDCTIGVSTSPSLICIFWFVLFVISCFVIFIVSHNFCIRKVTWLQTAKGLLITTENFYFSWPAACWIFENYIFCTRNIWHSARIILHLNATSWQLQCMLWCECLCNFPVAK